MRVTVNGETRSIEREVSLHELLEVLVLPTDRVAIELNGAVVRRKDWESTLIGDSDRIEIVHFVGGG